VRSRKAVANRLASIVGMLAALALALIIALGLGLVAYALSLPHGMMEAMQRKATTSRSEGISTEFIFFSIFGFSYLMWATLPLSIGSSRQFDPGRLLMYPIRLRKLFALDFISDLTNLQSVFAIPAIFAIGIGAGLGTGMIGRALPATLLTAAFGIALSKWLSTSIGSLIQRRRTRGETLVAMIGVLAGLGGALVGQLAPVLFRHASSFKGLRWTPPGAAAFALTSGLQEGAAAEYALSLTVLSAYTVVLLFSTYWIARRAVLGKGGPRRRSGTATGERQPGTYTGWEVPLLTPQLSAVVEKELRYVMRNAQLRMMVLMPLILIVVRFANTNRPKSHELSSGAHSFVSEFMVYGQGLMATGGVLYVFLILTGLSCNQFAFEEGGMRTFILSPVDRRQILLGKNIAITMVALVFSIALLTINHLVFRDLTTSVILFVGLSFITFAPLMSIVGNWLSVRFPKRMNFGKRLNVSGVGGLLLIPLLILLALPPLAAVAAGYLSESLLVEYATLATLAGLALVFYLLVINVQGRSLERREVEILEAVREPSDE
jgi:hypothetical protein